MRESARTCPHLHYCQAWNTRFGPPYFHRFVAVSTIELCVKCQLNIAVNDLRLKILIFVPFLMCKSWWTRLNVPMNTKFVAEWQRSVVCRRSKLLDDTNNIYAFHYNALFFNEQNNNLLNSVIHKWTIVLIYIFHWTSGLHK